MRTQILTLFTLLSLLVMPRLSAKEYEETLYSGAKDKVTIKYQIKESNGQVTIFFSKPVIQLSLSNRESYDDYDKVMVMFFDRNGGVKDDNFTSVIGGTEAIMVRSDDMKYVWSNDGYVFIEDDATINLTLLREKATLSIPIYLVYYKKRGKYEVFARCGTLQIQLEKGQNPSTSGGGPETVTRTVEKKEVVQQEEELTDAQMALMLVDRIHELLGQCSATSLPDGLSTYEDQLRKLELTITDKDTKAKISNVLKQIEDKKQEVAKLLDEIKIEDVAESTRQAVTNQARQDLAYVNERLDNIDKLTESDVAELKTNASSLRKQSYQVDDKELARDMQRAADRCDDEFKRIEDGKKRRTIWMVIGGIIAAIAMFFGNQAFQHYRNLQSQKGLEAMQDKIARRAENEAKRRAQSVVRSKVSRVQSQARRKANDAVRDGINKGVNSVTKGKGNNNYTI